MASNRKFTVPINLLNSASDPASADEGDIYYNTTEDRIRVYKNGTWVNVAYSDDVGITSIDYITFDTTPEASSTATGTMFWDSGDGIPKVILNSNVELGLGQEQVALCKNATGASIPKGSVVYINGAQGQRPTIALSDADTEPTSSKTLGLVAESIADGAEGFVVTFGVLRGVNTLGLTEGSALWLSSTPGGYQTSIPAEPAHLVFVGYVVKASATAGEIFVNPQNGYELNELHGVTTDTTPADNEVLAYDSSSGLWINQTHAEANLADAANPSLTGTITLNSTAIQGTNIQAVTTTDATTVYTLPTTYSSAEFLVQATQTGGKKTLSKLLMVNDETNILLTEYAITELGNPKIPLVLSAVISGGNLLLQATVSDANINSATIRVVSTAVVA